MKNLLGIILFLGVITCIYANGTPITDPEAPKKSESVEKVTCDCPTASLQTQVADCYGVDVNQVTYYDYYTQTFSITFNTTPKTTVTGGTITITPCVIPDPCCTHFKFSLPGYPDCEYELMCHYQ